MELMGQLQDRRASGGPQEGLWRASGGPQPGLRRASAGAQEGLQCSPQHPKEKEDAILTLSRRLYEPRVFYN